MQANSASRIDRRFSVAPMMDCTDSHARYFLRLFSENILLYTEMVTAAAVIHGDRDHLLGFNAEEHPIAVQLGGADAKQLAEATRICEQYGYDEVNLNVGCPSDRVQSGTFGACLMARPETVAECVQAMRAATSMPVTVKHRIGIDDHDSWDELVSFVQIQIDAGVDALIIHARKAWLNGLSPKQNREIPPLQYEWVYRLKEMFPDTELIINGGIKTMQECRHHLSKVDGVMLGREPYANPYMLTAVDEAIFGHAKTDIPSRKEILERYYPYIEQQLSAGMPLSRVIRHVIGLYHEQPNGRLWRRYLSENAYKKGADIKVLHDAAERVVPLEEAI